MKQRLLFVDDDPLILQGLRRSLHGMRAQWDLQFAGSGSDALALMAQQGASVPARRVFRGATNGALRQTRPTSLWFATVA